MKNVKNRFFALKKSEKMKKNRRGWGQKCINTHFRGRAAASPRSQRFFSLKNRRITLKMHQKSQKMTLKIAAFSLEIPIYRHSEGERQRARGANDFLR